MNFFKLFLLCWLGLSMIVSVATVGQPRKPITPAVAAVSLVIYGLIATAVVFA